MQIVIDFETRSACDLKKRGAWVYSEDPTTDVLCLACKWEGQPPWVVTPDDKPKVAATMNAIAQATTILGHNISFEYAIWTNVCEKRYGWPPIPVEKLRDSAAKTSMHALPRALGNVCEALMLAQQKDQFGYRIMMKMCKPRASRINEPEKNPAGLHGLYWHNDPADFKLLCDYCKQDVVSEEALSKALRDLPVKELEIWQLDQKINARGVYIDLVGARKMLEFVAEHEAKLLKRLVKLTNGGVRTAKQVEQLRCYLRGLGVDLPDLTAATVKEALKREDLNATVRDLLEIRRSLGRSSSAKYDSMVARASRDGRVRGTLLYHGAGTGRWSGAGIQPQNFPSRIKVSAPVEEMLNVIMVGGLPLHNALYDDDPMSTAGALTRSVITAPEGKELIVADYSAIEGRGLAWLAGEEGELELYRSGKDVYIASAANILHKPYDKVTPEERQSPGKVSVLACGYGGSAGAARKFNGDLAFRPKWEAKGLKGDQLEEAIDADIKANIINPWREAHPKTVAFWYDLERACMAAVQNPGRIETCRSISFTVRDKFLMCRLPSGRLLFYYDPDIRAMKTSWGEMKDCVTYMTVDSLSKKWIRTNTYGGKLAENCIAEGTKVLTDSGWKPIETVTKTDLVHDGVGFVSHGGIFLTSIQACVSIDGVFMTPDHEVLTNEGWKAASSDPRPYRPNLRGVNGYSPCPFGRKEEILGGALYLRKPSNSLRVGYEEGSKTGGNSELRLYDELLTKKECGHENSWDDQPSGVLGMEIDDGSVSASNTPSVEELRRSGYPSLRTLAYVRKLLERRWSDLFTRTYVGSEEQQRLLFSRKFPLGDSQSSIPQQTDKRLYRDAERTYDRVRGIRSVRDRGNNSSVPDRSSLASRGSSDSGEFSSSEQKVYDIRNCGPRSRFVVRGDSGPFIVHNCTQAICRDIMAEAMLRVEAAGYPIVMTVHDEIVCEIPEGFGSVEEFQDIMCQVPAWANGFPIKAAGWRGKRYRKG